MAEQMRVDELPLRPLSLADLTGFGNGLPAGDEDLLVEFSTDDPKAAAKMWGLVLMMAVRDGATAVHYHPGRGSVV